MKKLLWAGALCAVALLIISAVPGCAERRNAVQASSGTGRVKIYSLQQGAVVMSEQVVKSEEEWRKQLTEQQFYVLRKKGTEQAGTGKYAHNHEKGVYNCAGCGLELFRSEDKYESGTGWPSFFAPIAPENVATESDNSLFSRRTEVLCRRCGGHLGHVFDDGPRPTGLRYCMNSAALSFIPAAK
jgi:peptide-methionine (R)-S-oxide reductase